MEGKARFVVGTTNNKLLVYNEEFTTQKTFVIGSTVIAGIA